MNLDFEPFKAINTSLYLCDNKFHTEVKTSLLLGRVRCLVLIAHGTATVVFCFRTPDGAKCGVDTGKVSRTSFIFFLRGVRCGTYSRISFGACSVRLVARVIKKITHCSQAVCISPQQAASVLTVREAVITVVDTEIDPINTSMAAYLIMPRPIHRISELRHETTLLLQGERCFFNVGLLRLRLQT